MDPIQLLGLLSGLAIFIPPPWGPLIAGMAKFLPLIEEGVVALEAVNKADPQLLPHLQAVAQQAFGGADLGTVAKQLFAPQQMTEDERISAEERWFRRAEGDQ